jgi:ribosomal protein L4
MLNAITGGENALVLFTRGQEMVQRSVNNLPKSGALLVNYLNIRDLLKHDKVVMTLDALQEIQSIWGREG